MDKKHRAAIIAGNWKMNKRPSEVKEYASELTKLISFDRRVKLVVCPPFLCIPAAVKRLNRHIAVGAQNMHELSSGAYTGEVSAEMLTDAGVKYVILGHSERRQYFAETDEHLAAKVSAALRAGLTPILCVGETLEERENGEAEARVAEEINSALRGIGSDDAANVVIAYEPIWAIGTGRTATPEQAGEMCAFIRSTVENLHGKRSAKAMSILYGGSMNAKNAAELLAQEDIDGGLIGGASLKPEDFAEIYKAACEG